MRTTLPPSLGPQPGPLPLANPGTAPPTVHACLACALPAHSNPPTPPAADRPAGGVCTSAYSHSHLPLRLQRIVLTFLFVRRLRWAPDCSLPVCPHPRRCRSTRRDCSFSWQSGICNDRASFLLPSRTCAPHRSTRRSSSCTRRPWGPTCITRSGPRWCRRRAGETPSRDPSSRRRTTKRWVQSVVRWYGVCIQLV